MFRLRSLSGDSNWLQWGGKWISKKFNNNDFDYYFVVELINWPQSTGELCDGNKYVVEIKAVSIEQAGEVNMRAALRMTDLTEAPESDQEKVALLHTYGVGAVIKTLYGNNAHKLLRLARKELIVASGLFGLFMDQPQNRIGSTGWDLIKGEMPIRVGDDADVHPNN